MPVTTGTWYVDLGLLAARHTLEHLQGQRLAGEAAAVSAGSGVVVTATPE